MDKSSKNYHKIYQKHYGPIPKDSNGRSYEIHHIDGNHTNNDITNLKLVTIEEHYDIHYSQGDYGACVLIGKRLSLAPEEISNLASKDNQQRVLNGTHHLLKRPDGSSHASDRAKQGLLPTQVSSKNGTHHWSGINNGVAAAMAKNGTHPAQIASKNGTHHWQNGNGNGNGNKGINEELLAKGAHASQIKVTCLTCRKTTAINSFVRNHIKTNCT